MLIDTHCHFNHERLSDVDDCLRRAAEVGVEQMIVVGYSLESSRKAVSLAADYPGVLFAVVGVHPLDAKDWNESTEAELQRMCSAPSVVAVGEIGLDFHHNFSSREAQETAFRAQMKLAGEVGLPVVIHCREAYPETLQILKDEGVERTGGVMHCWAGSPEEAEQTVSLGMSLGFGGTLTFKTADSIREAARQIPAEFLLLETDAPYLAPVPYRGKRNEPAYTALVSAQLGELRGVSPEETAGLTTRNARRLFTRLCPRAPAAPLPKAD